MKSKDYKVYKYTCLINGKIYIGKTCQSLARRAKYRGTGYKGSVAFYNAIKKYNWDNFQGVILEEGLSAEEASEREIYWIKKLNSTDRSIGYNIQDQIYSKVTDGTRRKLKEAGKSHMLGKRLSEETKKKIRDHLPDRHGSNNPMYGKKLSKERKEQISESLRNRVVSEETREKLRRANTGIKNPGYGKHMSIQNKRRRGKKVVNLDTKEIFYTTIEAAEYYDIPYKLSVKDCCRGKQKLAGGYRWVYLDQLDNFEESCYTIVDILQNKEKAKK